MGTMQGSLEDTAQLWIFVKFHVHLFYNSGFGEAFLNHEKINTRPLGGSVRADSKVG